MKRRLVLTVSIIMAMSLMTGCGNNKEEAVATEIETTTETTTEVEAETEAATEVETVTEAEENTASSSDSQWEYGEYTYTGDDNITYAISSYICDEISKGYEQANVGIPYIIEIKRDDSDPEDIKVWGCFHYYTYNLIGDTLECQAGGSYPGCMHIKETDAGCGYVVSSFDPVLDGSSFDDSAKEIFGDEYDNFINVYSDDDLNNETRSKTIAEYVVSHNVPATKYKDYGWDPIELDLQNTLD